ncbi:MAG: OB-fold nucleic acid binding domain-containing protein, partial [Acidobacteriota bacterium]|nr:OB-fold nucleic acid binding domain-containing protein [Acidobacteriota bacterium]
MLLRDLIDGSDVDLVLVVREAECRARRDGAEYLKVVVGDRTGQVAAVAWDGVQAARAVCAPGTIVRVAGRFSVHERYGAQIVIRAIG